MLQVVGILGLALDGPVRILAVLVASVALALAFYVQFRGLTQREEADLDDEEDERDEEPSFAILMLGALLHFGYMLKGFVARLIPDRAGRPASRLAFASFSIRASAMRTQPAACGASPFSCLPAHRAPRDSLCHRICWSRSSARPRSVPMLRARNPRPSIPTRSRSRTTRISSRSQSLHA